MKKRIISFICAFSVLITTFVFSCFSSSAATVTRYSSNYLPTNESAHDSTRPSIKFCTYNYRAGGRYSVPTYSSTFVDENIRWYSSSVLDKHPGRLWYLPSGTADSFGAEITIYKNNDLQSFYGRIPPGDSITFNCEGVYALKGSSDSGALTLQVRLVADNGNGAFVHDLVYPISPVSVSTLSTGDWCAFNFSSPTKRFNNNDNFDYYIVQARLVVQYADIFTNGQFALEKFQLIHSNPSYASIPLRDFNSSSGSINPSSSADDFSSSSTISDDDVHIDGFWSFLEKPLNLIVRELRRVGNFVWDLVPGWLKTALTSIGSSVWDYLDFPFEALHKAVELVSTRLASLAQNIWNSLPDWLKTSLTSIGSSIWGFFGDAVEALKSTLWRIETFLKSIPEAIWNVLPDWLKDALIGLSNFVGGFFERIGNFFIDFIHDPLGTIKTIIDTIKLTISNFYSFLFDKLDVGFSDIIYYLKSLGTFVTNSVESIVLAVLFMSSSVTASLAITGYLPAIVGSCIVVVVALGIVKLLLGR